MIQAPFPHEVRDRETTPPPVEALDRPPRRDLGTRAQAWLRERHGLSFGRIEPAPSAVLVDGGACLAWGYARARHGWWAYVGTAALAFAALTGGAAGRRVDPQTYLALTSLAWAAVAITAIAWTLAWQTGRRDRRLVAVAWDAGDRPLTPPERASVADGLRARWPNASEVWLVTLRPLALPDNDAALRVFPVRETDLPRLSHQEPNLGPPAP